MCKLLKGFNDSQAKFQALANSGKLCPKHQEKAYVIIGLLALENRFFPSGKKVKSVKLVKEVKK